MGILDRFRSKKPEPVNEEKTQIIDLEKVPGWMNEQFGKDADAAKKKARRMGSEAIESVSDVREKLLRLEKSTFGGKDKTFAAANMAKGSFVKRGLSIIEGLRFSGPGKETHSGLTEFNSKLKYAVKEINKISPKQLFLLSKYFREESKRFMESLKGLERRTESISEFLVSEGGVIKMTEKLELYTKQLTDISSRLSRLKAQQRHIEAGIKATEEARSRSKKELEALLKGREWKEMSELEKSIRGKTEEISELENRANEILVSSKRPLKKLRHLLESREAFPENPFRDIVLEGRGPWLASMLESAKEHADSGSITLKPREAERLDEVSSWLGSELQKTRERHKQLSEKADELKRMSAKLDVKEKKSGIEKQLRESDENLKKQWAELDSKIKEIKGTGAEADDIKRRSENLVLDASGKKLVIKMRKEPAKGGI